MTSKIQPVEDLNRKYHTADKSKEEQAKPHVPGSVDSSSAVNPTQGKRSI